MAEGNGGDGFSSGETLICYHPTANVHYYSEIDDEGREYEEWWCDLCNCWIPCGFMEEIRERPDWEGGIV